MNTTLETIKAIDLMKRLAARARNTKLMGGMDLAAWAFEQAAENVAETFDLWAEFDQLDFSN